MALVGSAVDPHKIDPSFVVGPTRFGRMFKRSRWWGLKRLREWWGEQLVGGPVRAFRRPSGSLYTTVGIVDLYYPRGRRDEAMERRLRALEHDVGESYARIAELERRIGMRR